ncbi:jeltraxin-like isoform X1 [Esox lucius]|uniref:Pentraxin (PTX) domain-containing protein n=1 Tax=Esox lucius TaxID=8010 RepID=A0A3P8XJK9_ESOLU|nr:jeltraxin-like isoform X1 [Esox lucius]
MPVLLYSLILLLVLATEPIGARSTSYRHAVTRNSNLRGWMLTMEHGGKFTMYIDHSSNSTTDPYPSTSSPSPPTTSYSIVTTSSPPTTSYPYSTTTSPSPPTTSYPYSTTTSPSPPTTSYPYFTTSSPSPPTTSYPYFTTSSPPPYLSALSVCLRYMVELEDDFTIFSLTQGSSWNLMLQSNSRVDRLSIQPSLKLFSSYKQLYSNGGRPPWTGLCVTWEKKTSVAQLWRDGKVSIRKRLFGWEITGPPVLNIYRLEGQVTDVEVWNRVLSRDEIRDYMSGYYYNVNPGNVLSWSKATYSINKKIILEKINYT